MTAARSGAYWLSVAPIVAPGMQSIAMPMVSRSVGVSSESAPSWSPRIASTCLTPPSCARASSAAISLRCLPRVTRCHTGCMPASNRSRDASRLVWRPGRWITLIACAASPRSRARRNSTERSAFRGGVISSATANFPALSLAAKPTLPMCPRCLAPSTYGASQAFSASAYPETNGVGTRLCTLSFTAVSVRRDPSHTGPGALIRSRWISCTSATR